MPGKIEILKPVIADAGVDSRGAIYSYLPSADIKEFNYVVSRAGNNRGHHCHNEFDEYIMVVDGEMLIVENLGGGQTHKIILGAGQTVRIPQSVEHYFVPVTDCKFVNFLTKPWHLCQEPISKVKS